MASRKKTVTAEPEALEPVRVEITADRSVLHLEGTVGVAQARRLRDIALKLAEEGRPVGVRCERLGHLDCAAVQVLLALNETLKAQGTSVALEHASDSLQHTLRISGLANAF